MSSSDTIVVLSELTMQQEWFNTAPSQARMFVLRYNILFWLGPSFKFWIQTELQRAARAFR